MTPPIDPKLARAVAHWEAVWIERFNERAAIRQHDGGATLEDAEQRAFLEVDAARREAIPTVGNGANRRAVRRTG